MLELVKNSTTLETTGGSANVRTELSAEWSISKRLEPVQGAGKSRRGSPAFFS